MTLACPHCGGAIALALTATAPTAGMSPARWSPAGFTVRSFPVGWNGPLVDAAETDAVGICFLRYTHRGPDNLSRLQLRGPEPGEWGPAVVVTRDGWVELTDRDCRA